MRDWHLAHELEHLPARHVDQEQVAALLARRRPSVERVTRGAMLGEQSCAARAGRPTTGPATGGDEHDRERRDSEPRAHRASVRGPASIGALKDTVAPSLHTGRTTIIEVRTGRHENLALGKSSRGDGVEGDAGHLGQLPTRSRTPCEPVDLASLDTWRARPPGEPGHLASPDNCPLEPRRTPSG